MAKETFDRSKPHVNIGNNTATLVDSAGTLSVADLGSTTDGNPAPSSVLSFSATASASPENAMVAFPVDVFFCVRPSQ